jgi:hypothetical protein
MQVDIDMGMDKDINKDMARTRHKQDDEHGHRKKKKFIASYPLNIAFDRINRFIASKRSF